MSDRQAVRLPYKAGARLDLDRVAQNSQYEGVQVSTIMIKSLSRCLVVPSAGVVFALPAVADHHKKGEGKPKFIPTPKKEGD